VANGVSLYRNVAVSVWICTRPLCFSRYRVLAVGVGSHHTWLGCGW
jgi:hypothetical protein